MKKLSLFLMIPLIVKSADLRNLVSLGLIGLADKVKTINNVDDMKRAGNELNSKFQNDRFEECIRARDKFLQDHGEHEFYALRIDCEPARRMLWVMLNAKPADSEAMQTEEQN